MSDGFDHMEMPAPCSVCGTVQELNDFRSRVETTELVCDKCWTEDNPPEVDEQGRHLCHYCGRYVHLNGLGFLAMHKDHKTGAWCTTGHGD